MANAIRKPFAAGAVVAWMMMSSAVVAVAEDELRVAHILLASKAEAEAVAKEISTAGGDAISFKKAVYAHSKDAATKPLGGVLPTMLRDNGSYDAAFTKAAFELKAGEISGPVKSQFGWHLIQVLKRQQKGGATPVTPTNNPTTDSGTSKPFDPIEQARKIAEEQAAAAKIKADAEARAKAAGATTPPIETPRAVPEVVSLPTGPKPVNALRRTARKIRSVSLIIESALSGRLAFRGQRNFSPSQAVELSLLLKNEGADAVKVPSPELLPLGFVVTRGSDGESMPADYSAMTDPTDFFTDLKTWQITGAVVSLNDYFKTLSASGRYELKWSGTTFFTNLEARFAKASELPDYAAIKKALSPRTGLRVDQIYRDTAPRWENKAGQGFNFSIFPRVDKNLTYYARVKFRQKTPVVFELSGKGRGNSRAVEQFVKLANDGFYDSLSFHDVQKDDFALGGCPTGNGFGAPSTRLPGGVKNDDNTKHERGTVSFVTRTSPRQGPFKGGEIGSIFFVSLKDHSEWDDTHVPFGKVVEGLDVFDELNSTHRIQSVTILSADEYDGAGKASGGDDAADGAATIITSGYPQAVIKTGKGDLTVSLYDDVAYHTIASFITRAEDGFFEKGPDDGKMSFFESVEQAGKTIALMTGSPTNADAGGPGYKLRDEVNSKKCERGALVMLKEQDEDGGYVPNSAGSAFFICVQPIPYYDFEGKFTVFGKVTGGLDVLDKLVKGDEIVEVKITKKKKRAYGTFRRAN